MDLGVARSSRAGGTKHLASDLHVNLRRFGGSSHLGSHFPAEGGNRAAAAWRGSAKVAESLTEPPPQSRHSSADRPTSSPSRPWLVTRDRTRPPMRRLPKTPAELEGLPDWSLLMTDRAAASYHSLSPEDFERGVRHLELPAARRTPGGPRWSRADSTPGTRSRAPPRPMSMMPSRRPSVPAWGRSDDGAGEGPRNAAGQRRLSEEKDPRRRARGPLLVSPPPRGSRRSRCSPRLRSAPRPPPAAAPVHRRPRAAGGCRPGASSAVLEQRRDRLRPHAVEVRPFPDWTDRT